MKFISELIARWKWGYPLGSGYRAYPKTRDEYVIWKDGKEFEVFVEHLADHAVVMSSANKPRFFLNPAGEPLGDRDWEEGLGLLTRHFKGQGKKVIFQ